MRSAYRSDTRSRFVHAGTTPPPPRDARCGLGAVVGRGTVRLAAAVLLLLACDNEPDAPPDPPTDVALQLELVTDDVDSPVYLTVAPGDAQRLFVVEQSGRIRVIRDGTLLDAPFLDVSGAITTGGEQGLLSLAFHPGYAQNGRFFIYFTDVEGDTRVVEYRRGAGPDVADPEAVDTLLAVDQPFSNHNGGLLLFGPDGYLYVGLGDGGSGGDPQGNGQNLGTLLGAILRLDVDDPGSYRIPSDNPFAGQAGARGEIWAYGLRNPWRFSFDRATGDLYIADVGQGEWEEVNVEPAASGGRNYGWNIMEGRHCYDAGSCDQDGLTLPVHEYSHDDGCSITGGYVYRGSRIPALQGHYFFSDFCGGWLRSFRYDGGEVQDLRDWSDQLGRIGGVTSFGEDAGGELYLTTAEGEVFRIAPNLIGPLNDG